MKKDLETLNKLIENYDFEKITENFEIVTKFDRNLEYVYNCAILENGQEFAYEYTIIKKEKDSDNFIVKVEAVPDFEEDLQNTKDLYLLSLEEAVQLYNREVLEKQIKYVEAYLQDETDKEEIEDLNKEIEDLKYYYKRSCESAINSF